MRHALRDGVLVVVGALLLSGCGWFGGKETKLVCPASYIAPDTDKMAVFKPGGSTLGDVSYGVQIATLVSKCERADKGLSVDTRVAFHLVSNDKTLRAGNFQYFVSVVDGYQNILTKNTYTVPFEFDARVHDMNRQDELIENLPLRDAGTGGNYAIVVGLQLTEAQLKFNRAAAHTPSIAVPPTVSVALPPKPTNSAASP
jgi:hypothetical protein